MANGCCEVLSYQYVTFSRQISLSVLQSVMYKKYSLPYYFLIVKLFDTIFSYPNFPELFKTNIFEWLHLVCVKYYVSCLHKSPVNYFPCDLTRVQFCFYQNKYSSNVFFLIYRNSCRKALFCKSLYHKAFLLFVFS